MPNQDRTGPLGEGPMTGRQGGVCSGNTAPEIRRGFGRDRWIEGRGDPIYPYGGGRRGRRCGRGRGMGRGRIDAANATLDADALRNSLETRADDMEAALKELKQRIELLGPSGNQ